MTASPLRTHPASTNGGIRPTGSDRTTPIVGVASRFPVGVMLENPALNQAGIGAPTQSAFGQSMRRLVAGGHIVRQSAPILPPTTGGFRGFIGLFRARAARGVIVPKGTSYTGQLPLSQQPKVTKPMPWTVGSGAKYSG